MDVFTAANELPSLSYSYFFKYSWIVTLVQTLDGLLMAIGLEPTVMRWRVKSVLFGMEQHDTGTIMSMTNNELILREMMVIIK